VSYSDGKDSRVIAQLAVRTFEHVVGFFMYLVPNLECVDTALAEAERRWGFKVLQYPHWLLSRLIRNGVYRPPASEDVLAAVPEWTLRDCYDLVLGDTGIPLVLTGAKASDSMWRRRNLKAVQYQEVFHPIEKWLRVDVEAFLAANGIPMPVSSGRNATGIDLSTPSLLWLYDTFPRDFEKLCHYFPFAFSVVARRRFYSITA